MTDVLGGKRILFSLDNLVVTGSFFTAGPYPPCSQNCLFQPSFYLQTTAPNTLSFLQLVESTAFQGAPYTTDLLPTTTNLGRVFNLPQDILVRIQASVLPANQAPLVTVVLQDLTSTAFEPIIPFPPPYSPPAARPTPT